MPVLRRASRAPRRALPACVLCACTALGIAAPAASALDAAGLRARLARELRAAGPFAGAYVRDLDTGETLYATKEDVARPPASLEKLYTTSTALLRFGASARLRTQVLGTGSLDSLGVWHGDLYLRGVGDPTLGQAGIGSLALSLGSRIGIRRVAGAVVGDESLFDRWRGAARTGFAYDRDIGGVLSALAVGRGFSRDGLPAKEAARRLTRALRTEGVRVSGRPAVGVAPGEVQELAAVQSPPVAELIRQTNVPSDNFDAEMLLKDLGAQFGAGGTTAAGATVVRRQVASFGIHPRIVDGSGLSRANLTTPRQVVRLLDAMQGEEAGPTFEASLAVAGRSGTVSRRMRATPAQDRCHTKTGTLRAVSALAGYCQTTGARHVAFALMMSTTRITRAHRVQDRMAAAIATYGA